MAGRGRDYRGGGGASVSVGGAIVAESESSQAEVVIGHGGRLLEEGVIRRRGHRTLESCPWKRCALTCRRRPGGTDPGIFHWDLSGEGSIGVAHRRPHRQTLMQQVG